LTALIYHALGDYSASQKQYEGSLTLSREIGWRYAETTILVNLGNNYFDLGCYDISADYHEQALFISRETGNKEYESISTDTLGLIAHALGKYDSALEQYEKALAISIQINNERSTGYVLTHLGYTLIELGDFRRAQDALYRSLLLRQKLGDQNGVVDVKGGLALVAMNTQDLALSLIYVYEILNWVGLNGTDGLESPVQLYLFCYRILRLAADQDSEYEMAAQSVLTTGYALLQERAARIQGDYLRRQYLENVPFNREVQAA
jgi:tetratricopeptide (TPR) repeat protein